MALKLTRRMPGFEGAVAGQTATLRMPIGLTYHQILLTFAGVTLAQMNEIRVVANGQNIWRVDSGTIMNSYNLNDGRLTAGGLLVLDFDRYNLRTRAGEEFTALGTGVLNDPTPVTTLTLEIDIDGAAVGTALSAKAVQSSPRNLGLIKKIRTFTRSIAGAGDLEIDDLPKGDRINRIFIDFSAGNMSRLRIERDNFRVFDRTDTENERLATDGVRVPQASQYVYDPTEAGNGAEGLETSGVHELLFTLTHSALATDTLGVEYIGSIDA